MRKTVPRSCEYSECGKTFNAPEYELKRGGGRYCSNSCSVKYINSLKPAPESNHRLNAIAREIYIERHGNPICSKCGEPNADVHHKDGNRKNNVDENHDPLCRSCHISHENRINPKRRNIAHVTGLTNPNTGKFVACPTTA